MHLLCLFDAFSIITNAGFHSGEPAAEDHWPTVAEVAEIRLHYGDGEAANIVRN